MGYLPSTAPPHLLAGNVATTSQVNARQHLRNKKTRIYKNLSSNLRLCLSSVGKSRIKNCTPCSSATIRVLLLMRRMYVEQQRVATALMARAACEVPEAARITDLDATLAIEPTEMSRAPATMTTVSPIASNPTITMLWARLFIRFCQDQKNWPPTKF